MYKQFFVALIALSASCTSKQASVATEKAPTDLVIVQGENRISCVAGKQEITLERKPFAFEFSLYTDSEIQKLPAYFQVACTDKKEDLRHLNQGPIGVDNPLFSPGSGLAGYSDKSYPHLVIQGNGQHYVWYTNEEERRADFLFKEENGRLRLRWDVDSLLYYNEEMHIKDSKFGTLYIMAYASEDTDEVIEKGEYSLLTVRFK